MIAKVLLKANANPNAVDSKGTTPLHLASGFFKEKLVRTLLKHNSEINSKSHDGQTPLHIACATNRIQIANVLLEKVRRSSLLRLWTNMFFRIQMLMPQIILETHHCMWQFNADPRLLCNP